MHLQDFLLERHFFRTPTVLLRFFVSFPKEIHLLMYWYSRRLFHGLQLLGFWGMLSLFTGCGSTQPDTASALSLPEQVDYNFHIKPILSDRCYACHGPDAQKREAGLRLDMEEGAFSLLEESGKKALVAGNLSRSALWHRINSSDPMEVMPPPDSHLSLSEYEIALIGRWIDQGAKWKEHWAFLPPLKVRPPKVQDGSWIQNDIDAFILARLEQEGLSPSPPADRRRLLRRLSFDLRGLPPSPAGLEVFLVDSSAQAYEQWVDSFLASPAFGERMAQEWMDVARYADSHGLHADGWRNMWPWRDWVIQAFTQNMPYDQFLLEQLAGDMLPEASKDQILATAFQRNHQMTAEGGAIDEEFRLEYVYDRTNTLATAFLGLTMECARCHDHKFDPISQKEYYGLAAFFNNVKELGMTGDDGNYGPMLTIMDDSLDAAFSAIETELTHIDTNLRLSREKLLAQQAFLESQGQQVPDPGAFRSLHLPLDQVVAKRNTGGQMEKRADGDLRTNITGNLEQVPGKQGKALRFDDDYDVLYISEVGAYEMTDAFSVSLWVYPEKDGENQTLIGNSGDKNNFWRGWELTLDTANQVSAKLIHSLPHNYLHKQTEVSIPRNTWTHILLTYEGSGKAAGLELYLNGEKAPTKTYFDRLSKSITPINSTHKPSDRALRVAKSYRAFTGDNGIFLGALDEIQLFSSALTPLEAYRLAGKTPPEDATLHSTHAWQRGHPDRVQLTRRRDSLLTQRLALLDTLSEVMVMEEMPAPRPMYVHDRGQYDLPTEQVAPGTPQSVGEFPPHLPQNRLGLAQWLTSPANPLTARVTVNRYWQMIFGRGLVATPQDLGSQGTLPSHPQILDALALRFIESGWDVKALIKYLVMSATYQQDSRQRTDLQERDPENLLFAQGPAYRMSAEMIRDNALAASGLLSPTIGGPSVKPYQPEGLWIDKGSFSPRLLRYKADTLDGMHRRSLYTFIRRTSPPPSMIAFDAPTRANCIVQRQTTNTPMQALVLLNDPQYVEAARKLGERMLVEGGNSLPEQLTYGFLLATSRQLSPDALEIYEKLFAEEHTGYSQHPEEAQALLSVGVSPVNAELPQEDLAAMTVVASMMLNHDEAYMKR